jgi:hypothetical protein
MLQPNQYDIAKAITKIQMFCGNTIEIISLI